MAKTMAEYLTSIADSKEAIRLAIVAKGQECDKAVPLSEYAAKIGAIFTGNNIIWGTAEFYQCVFVDATNRVWAGYKAVLENGEYRFETTITEGLQYTSVTPEVGKVYTVDALAQICYMYDLDGSAGECPNGADCVTATCPTCNETYCSTHGTHTCDTGGDNGGGGNNNDDDDGEDTGGGNGGGNDTEEETGGGGEEVTGDPELTDEQGYVRIAHYSRFVGYRLFPFPTAHDDNCNADVYLTSITFNWEKWWANGKYVGEFGRNYGKIASFPGSVEEWEDDNGELVRECISYPEVGWGENFGDVEYWDDDKGDYVAVDANAIEVAQDATADIMSFIDGKLHNIQESEYPTEYPTIASSGWQGYQNYLRSSHGKSETLSVVGDTISASTKTDVGYYGIWGDHPCTSGDGWGNVSLDTYVFEWIANDTSAPAPEYVVLEDESGVQRKYEFDVEYCLQGKQDINMEMFGLMTCPVYDDHAPWVVIRGTVVGDGSTDEYQAPEYVKTRTFTYKGVIM